MAVDKLERIRVEEDGNPYHHVYHVLGLPSYYCEPYGWSTGLDVIHKDVGQPFGLKLKNLEKNVPIVSCDNKGNSNQISFIGIYPGYYKITENLKLKRPLVYLQLTQGKWILSVVGKLISCGKVYSDEVNVWYDHKTKSTHMRMEAQNAVTLPVGCLLPLASPDHIRHTMFTRYLKPSNDSTLNIIFKKNQTLTNFQDKQLEFNFREKTYYLEESLSIFDEFWIGETIVPEIASKDLINALYPELTELYYFFVKCVDFSKVFTFYIHHC